MIVSTMVVVLASAVYLPAIVESAQLFQNNNPLQITVSPDRISTLVGTPVDVTITLNNQDTTSTPALAVHIDIIDPKAIGSVDPEDWTAELTRSIPSIESGNQALVNWSITPIEPGDFLIYAVAVAVDENLGFEQSALSVSWGTPIHVESKRSFNPQGALPVAIAMPSIFGVILLWRNWAMRRRPNV